MLKYVKMNGNPWGKQLPDCMIRVPCIALNMSYPEVCRIYGIACEDGEGIVRDEKLTAENFTRKFKEYLDDWDFGNFSARRESVLPNIKEWFEDRKNTGKYLVCLRHSNEMKFLPTYHASFVDTDKGILCDKFDCRNMEVIGFAKFNSGKVLSNKDENSRFRHILNLKLKNF